MICDIGWQSRVLEKLNLRMIFGFPMFGNIQYLLSRVWVPFVYWPTRSGAEIRCGTWVFIINLSLGYGSSRPSSKHSWTCNVARCCKRTHEVYQRFQSFLFWSWLTLKTWIGHPLLSPERRLEYRLVVPNLVLSDVQPSEARISVYIYIYCLKLFLARKWWLITINNCSILLNIHEYSSWNDCFWLSIFLFSHWYST